MRMLLKGFSRRIFSYSIALILVCNLALFAGMQDTTKSSIPVLESTRARATIDSIRIAIGMYFQDKGVWPCGIEDLIWDNYVSVSPEVGEHWSFKLIADSPVSIKAIAIEADSEGFLKNLSYDIPSGKWTGYGIPDYSRKDLSPEEQADLTGNAIGVIQAIRESSKAYYMDKGEWPETVDVLERRSYIEIPKSALRQWQFGILGNPPEIVVAVSTGEMPNGAGRTIEYDVVRDKWRGYGLSRLKSALQHSSIIHVEYSK